MKTSRRELLSFSVASVIARAGAPANGQKSVTLPIVATNSDGKPVTDLTAAELNISDNGKRQQATSLQLNHSDGPAALVLLFDLLNLNMSSRGVVWDELKRSFPEMPASSVLYLYLLVKDGSLYAVHALPELGAAPQYSDTAWMRNIGPLLEAAMNKVNRLRPTELETQVYLRFQATWKARCRGVLLSCV